MNYDNLREFALRVGHKKLRKVGKRNQIVFKWNPQKEWVWVESPKESMIGITLRVLNRTRPSVNQLKDGEKSTD